MVWNPLKLILLCILVSFFEFATTKAQDTNASFLDQKCFGDKTTTNSSYARNLRTLVSSLSSTAAEHKFYNNTVLGSTNHSDTVYGLFMCRSDIPLRLCNLCVESATKKLSSDPQCSLTTQGMIWYDECMVRYSNAEFFSTVETHTGVCVCNAANISSNPESFMNSLSSTMNQTAEKASISSNSYSTKQETLSSQNQTIYCLAQCTQDLSPQQCQTCLSQAIVNLPSLCGGKQGGKALFPSCNIRYELYPFYLDVTNEVTPQELVVPETKYPKTDSEYSEDSGYLSHNCSSNDNRTTGDSAFQSNLGTLLSDLTSNATTRNGFQAQEGTAYGLFTCRGDIPRPLCEKCVQSATDRILSECRRLATTEAIIWYNHCWLRYSDRNFFSSVETSPMFRKLNITSTNPALSSVVGFQLSNKLAEMANKTGDRVERYQTGSLRLNDNQTLYVLGQCSLDLSSNDCGACLSGVIGMAIPWSTLGSLGGRVSYPSCNLRFELFKFYDLTLPTPTSTTPPTGKGRSKNIILILTPTIILSGILFTFCCYLVRRKARRNNKSILKENFGHESSTIESLQFNLAIIEAATNNFSRENKIGKGGFGEVYKGILIDGRPIAVKRLSRNSKQGVEEFKNEILLIAKLQHRNLVTFIGFCLDEQEKILIYEYVPNKSLDYFLFDTNLEKALSWSERYKIIGGIARGILYLHELSRLKVIHHDLKPSNVLLDENMNPKISDFGLARIIEIDQQEGSTNRIIGTYGYMSPEYAMFGQFSEKSDVYSFGVMILEIISGKKNRGSYNPNRVADGLLQFVWKHWKDETPLDILDPNLKANYSNVEVIKCIQIGLLCVQENIDARPTMVTIFSYLTGQSVELPSPQDPTFLLYQGMDPMVARESSLRHANSSIPSSINEMSISEFYPQ